MTETKDEGMKGEQKAEIVGVEVPPTYASNMGLAVSSRDGKEGDIVVLTFYWSPPELKVHTHHVIARIALDWESAASLAKNISDKIAQHEKRTSRLSTKGNSDNHPAET